MSTAVGGSVVWNLDVDSKKLTSGLSDARSEVEKTSKTIGNSLSSAFKSAEAASLGFAGGIAAIGASLGFALKSAGEMEMLRSSLDTLTGSADKGAKMFKNLNTFAAKTPFETMDLAKATETMLAFGISTEKVMPHLKMLGDVSLGNKEKLRGLTLAFSQVQSTGRLMGQDLLQMINQGFNPLTIISKQTGKSMSVLKDEMAAGSISADMVTKAFVTATSRGGLFFNGMDRGASTLNGIMSTLSDTIGMTMREVVGLSETGDIVKGGLFDKVKTAITDLINFLNTNKQAFVATFKTIFDWISSNGPIVIGFIVGGLTPAFYGLATAIGASVYSLAPFIIAGVALGIAGQYIVQQMGGLNNIMLGFNSILAILNPIVEAFGLMFYTLVLPAINYVWSTIQTNLVPALKELWAFIEPVLIPLLKILAGVFGVVVIASILALVGIIYVLVETLTFLVNWTKDSIQKMVDAFQFYLDFVTLVWENVKQRAIEVIDFYKGIPGMIGNALRGVYDAIVKPFNDAWNKVVEIGNKIKEAINNINPWERHSPSLIDNVRSGVAEIIRQYSSLKNIELPAVASMQNDQYGGSVGSSRSPEVVSGVLGAGANVTVNIGEVKSSQDVDMIAREMGFRLLTI